MEIIRINNKNGRFGNKPICLVFSKHQCLVRFVTDNYLTFDEYKVYKKGEL